MSSTAVHLVFAGEILAGYSQAQVREKLGRRLRLDEQRLHKLFSGQRVVIKRDLSPADAADWVQRFRAVGAVLHAVPAKAAVAPDLAQQPASAAPVTAPLPPKSVAKAPPPPAPGRRPALPPPDTSLMLSLVPDSELPPASPLSPPPPPSAAPPRLAATASRSPSAPAVATSPEEITCPNCGERQSKRVICRSCVCDMPRTLAALQAEAEARRQARLEELRARNEQRLAREQRPQDDDDFEDDVPPLLSLSLDGRMGRVRFLGSSALGLACTLGLLMGVFTLAVTLSTTAVLWVGLLVGLVLVWWGIRLTVLRLHDLNRSGWFALLQLVPAVNGLFSLVLLLWPGNAEENDYGTPVDDARWLWAILGVVVFGATTLLTTPQLWPLLAR